MSNLLTAAAKTQDLNLQKEETEAALVEHEKLLRRRQIVRDSTRRYRERLRRENSLFDQNELLKEKLKNLQVERTDLSAQLNNYLAIPVARRRCIAKKYFELLRNDRTPEELKMQLQAFQPHCASTLKITAFGVPRTLGDHFFHQAASFQQQLKYPMTLDCVSSDGSAFLITSHVNLRISKAALEAFFYPLVPVEYDLYHNKSVQFTVTELLFFGPTDKLEFVHYAYDVFAIVKQLYGMTSNTLAPCTTT